MQLEEEENPSEPCALPGDAFTVSLQSACPGVQPASPRAPGDRSAPAAASAAAAAAAGSGRGTRAEGERERTARERREGRKRVITRGRRGPARLQSSSGAVRHPGWANKGPLWVSTGRPGAGRVYEERRRAGRAVVGRRGRRVAPAPPNSGSAMREIREGEEGTRRLWNGASGTAERSPRTTGHRGACGVFPTRGQWRAVGSCPDAVCGSRQLAVPLRTCCTGDTEIGGQRSLRVFETGCRKGTAVALY